MPWRALLHSALYRSAVRTRNAQSERTYSGTCTGKEVGLTHVPPATENGGLDGWYRLPRPEQGVCRAHVCLLPVFAMIALPDPRLLPCALCFRSTL